jgi:hypothetical protein
MKAFARLVLEQSCRLIALTAFATSVASCSATSRMPAAQISEVNGLPCFAVADEADTRDGVRLYSLLVSEQESNNYQSLPTELWKFNIDPPGSWINTIPQNCIRYGEMPVTAKALNAAKPLEPGRVYVVFIGARPKDSGVPVVGYRAEFCIKATSSGKTIVKAIPWDKEAQKWRYEVCEISKAK